MSLWITLVCLSYVAAAPFACTSAAPNARRAPLFPQADGCKSWAAHLRFSSICLLKASMSVGSTSGLKGQAITACAVAVCAQSPRVCWKLEPARGILSELLYVYATPEMMHTCSENPEAEADASKVFLRLRCSSFQNMMTELINFIPSRCCSSCRY